MQRIFQTFIPRSLLVVICTLFLGGIYAQNGSVATKPSHRWQIGIDILPLLKDTSYHMKESIFLKWRYKERTTLRGRFGVYFDKGNNLPTQEPRVDTIWAFRPRFYISLGMEKPLWQNGKINVNWGGDLFCFYSNNDVKQHMDNTGLATPPTIRLLIIDDVEVKTGINAFLNAEYQINSHFAVNVEAFWQFAYRNERYFNQFYQAGKLTSYGGSTIKRFLTQTQPLSSINLIYKF